MQNDALKVQILKQSGFTRAILVGTIDEDTDFGMFKKLQGMIVFNFKGVTGINSCGIRNWVGFLNEIKQTPIAFEECPPLIVRQMNMVPSFLGHAEVRSVFVPYVCDDCDTEQLVLIDSAQYQSGRPNIPDTKPCASCGDGEMELDGSTKQYFAFAA